MALFTSPLNLNHNDTGEGSEIYVVHRFSSVTSLGPILFRGKELFFVFWLYIPLLHSLQSPARHFKKFRNQQKKGAGFGRFKKLISIFVFYQG